METGAIIAKRYQLDRRIGEGGMGVVWAATHLLTRRPVALKFLKGASEEHTKRFLREARIAGMLGHPNIVEVHDVLVLPEDGTPTMVMELLGGESLDARLQRTGAIPIAELVTIMLPVVSAVGSAHALGVVHRDLKPDNIFLARSPLGDVHIKVLDFGIAKLTATEGDAASTSGLTQTGAVMGTPYYMSPEQVFGEKHIDRRADVWALGVVLYECLSGKRPIEGENFGQIFKNIAMGDIVPIDRLVPELPADIAALVGQMLLRDRERRPTDLREVFSLLSQHAQVSVQAFGPPRVAQSSVPPPPSGERQLPSIDSVTAAPAVVPARRLAPNSRSATIAAAAAVLLGLGLGAWRFAHAPAHVELVPAPSAAPAGEPPPVPSSVADVAAPLDVLVSSAPPPNPATSASAPTTRRAFKPAPIPSDKPADKRKLPGGIHGDSPY